MAFIEGKSCPNCNKTVETTDGTEYECPGCQTAFDVADLFYP